MSRTTQITITFVIFLAVFVSVIGGALAGGAAGFFVTQRELARFETQDSQAVVQTASAETEQAEAQPAREAPDVEIIPAPSAPSNGQSVQGNLAETMVDAVQRVAPAVVTVINRDGVGVGSGSGVVVSEEGYIITNHHVVDGASELSIIFADNSRQEGTLIGSDPLSDIAVVQVSGDVPAVATVGDSQSLAAGEPVLAIGSPLGNFRNTVTSGVVSALNRSVAQLEGLIQTDASINQGNSGGPLINLNGEVVGINTLVVRGGNSILGESAQAEGLGFAVPSVIFRTVSNQIIQTGEMVYPYLGIFYRPIDGDIAAEENLPVFNGALVESVEPGTPADNAGLQPGDIITEVAGVSLDQNNSLRFALTQYQPGDTVDLTVQRGGEEITIELTLAERPEELNQAPAVPRP
jgi:2-alkenal reductase